MKILLIDHETYRLQSLSRGLRIAGHHVLEAETLQQALAHVKREALPLDLIVTDCSSRILCNPEMMQAVQERFPGIHVVATTDRRPDVSTESLPWPVHYLFKPFSEVELNCLVEKACLRSKTY
ncbi:MAG: hypothetical protein AB9873_15780 [Syntrophobacteraceae bacterium]